jgi:hypothetical protein
LSDSQFAGRAVDRVRKFFVPKRRVVDRQFARQRTPEADDLRSTSTQKLAAPRGREAVVNLCTGQGSAEM